MAAGRDLARIVLWAERNLLVECALAGLLALIAAGLIGAGGVAAALAAAGLCVLLAYRLWRMARRFTPRMVELPGADRERRQLSLLMLGTVALLLCVSGGRDGRLDPLWYLLLAACGGYERRPGNLAWLLIGTLFFDTSMWWAKAGRQAVELALYLVFDVAFLGISFALHRAHLLAREREVAARISAQRTRLEEEAALYRQLGKAPELPSEECREFRRLSSARELGVSAANLLEVAQAALRPHTIALFLLSPDGKTLQLKQALCEDPALLQRGPLPAGEGMLGAVLKSGHAVSRDHLRDSSMLTYYASRPSIRTFIGVPVLEGEHRRGVLLADRRAEIPFGEEDEALLLALSREVWRTFSVERVLERSDEEQQKLRLFYESSRQINRAVNQSEVLDEVLGAVRRIFGSVDFAALVLRDPPESRQLVIRAVVAPESLAEWRERALQQALEGDDHLCALAIKSGFAVPAVPYHKAARSQRSIFGRRLTPAGLDSLKVFPLKVAATKEGRSVPGEVETLGTLVVGSTARGVFPEIGDASASSFVQETLETLSDIAAMAIQSAQRFEQLLRLATTDGLTGLHNHRRFQELLEGAVAEALRYQNPLSLILSDVDHFKKVNDSYGHPTGDEVLRRVARVLSELARQSDRVCRYGGEEFAVIMPHTDAEGARVLAERFREEIREQSFDAGGQRFQVSISLGICTLPANARHKQELIDRADQALYHAKHTGRDRVVHYAGLPKDAGSPE